MFISLPFIFGGIFESLLTPNFTKIFKNNFQNIAKKDVAIH